jgi:hypothetical protein
MTQSAETFEEGDSFSAEDHLPGTFVIYDKERLSGLGILSEKWLSEYGAKLPIPEKPFDVSVSDPASGILRSPRLEYIGADYDNCTDYARVIHLGIVESFGRKGKKILLGLPLREISKQGSEIVFETMGMVDIEPEEFSIGETSHLASFHFGNAGYMQRIQRINSLEVRGIGAEEGPRSSILKHLGSSAVRVAHNIV